MTKFSMVSPWTRSQAPAKGTDKRGGLALNSKRSPSVKVIFKLFKLIQPCNSLQYSFRPIKSSKKARRWEGQLPKYRKRMS